VKNLEAVKVLKKVSILNILFIFFFSVKIRYPSVFSDILEIYRCSEVFDINLSLYQEWAGAQKP
jgi:hypothetical protein